MLYSDARSGAAAFNFDVTAGNHVGCGTDGFQAAGTLCVSNLAVNALRLRGEMENTVLQVPSR